MNICNLNVLFIKLKYKLYYRCVFEKDMIIDQYRQLKFKSIIRWSIVLFKTINH